MKSILIRNRSFDKGLIVGRIYVRNLSDAGSPPAEKKIPQVAFEDISRAHYRILSGIKRTHCDVSQFLSEICECNVVLKKDFTQFTGSFKERGARNALMLLPAEVKRAGVVAASAGNHALALAWHGKDLGIPVTCVMPINAPLTKVEKCRKFGANVINFGNHIGDAKEYAQREFAHLKYINGYNDPEIIAGAGTIGIEILEQCRDVDAVLVPVGGGGLIAGVALAVKTLRPSVEVIGVEPDNVASFQAALAAGAPTYAYKDPTLADGLAVPIVGDIAFETARHHVDYCCSVTEKMIALSMLRLIEMEKLVVEGGGASGLAALLPGGPLFRKFKGKTVAVILGGGNIDTTLLGRVIERGLAADMRLVRFTVTVSDRPGGIANLTRDIADIGASVKDIYHERAWLQSHIDQVNVKVVAETMGEKHTNAMLEKLESKYHVQRDYEEN